MPVSLCKCFSEVIFCWLLSFGFESVVVGELFSLKYFIDSITYHLLTKANSLSWCQSVISAQCPKLLLATKTTTPIIKWQLFIYTLSPLRFSPAISNLKHIRSLLPTLNPGTAIYPLVYNFLLGKQLSRTMCLQAISIRKLSGKPLGQLFGVFCFIFVIV